MKRIMLIVSLIITLNYAFAQDSTKFSLPKLGFIFSGSALSNSLGDLNNFFKSQEMPFSEYAYNQSVGVTYRVKNQSFYSSVQYTMLYSENEDQNLRSRLKGWGLYTTFNYDLLRNRPTTLFYPYIGLGFSSYELNLINKNYNYQ